MSNPPERAGFTREGKIPKGSVTRLVSEEVEGRKSELLEFAVKNCSEDGSLFAPSRRERLIYNNCDTFSAQFVGALPCPIGILSDRVLCEAFAMYFGCKSPAMMPFTQPDQPHYIGRRNKEQLVDLYGDVVARAEVNGCDFIRSHEQMKLVWNGMMCKVGFATTLEAPYIFHGVVGWNYLQSYTNAQSSKDTIIPDILLHNYPADGNGHGNAVVPAMFDIKTVRVDKSESIYCPWQWSHNWEGSEEASHIMPCFLSEQSKKAG